MLLNVCAHESAYKYHQCNPVIDLFTNTGIAFPCRLCTHHKLTRARSCSVSKRTTVTVRLAVNADSETEYKCRLQLTETTVSVCAQCDTVYQIVRQLKFLFSELHWYFLLGTWELLLPSVIVLA